MKKNALKYLQCKVTNSLTHCFSQMVKDILYQVNWFTKSYRQKLQNVI